MVKKQSNPGSTGGVGFSFENHVQASYVTLMLTGGRVPTLPSWPVIEVKLQAKIEGYQIDDAIVVVKKPNSNETRKLLGQMKRSVTVNTSNNGFKETLEAGWRDYNNPQVFKQGFDSIALITGVLSEVDHVNVQWLLNHARHTKNAHDFLRDVNTARFSPNKAQDKLNVFKSLLKQANNGEELLDNQLYEFLKHFHILAYDLDNENGIALSLIQSHISQFDQVSPQNLWARILAVVQAWNHHAGSLTYENIPEDLKEAFRHRVVSTIPDTLSDLSLLNKVDWNTHSDATLLALSALIGSWDENSEADRFAVSQIAELEYNEWLVKAREILNEPNTLLSVKNGIWSINNRAELLKSLSGRIFDHNLQVFQRVVLEILKERDPSFELDSKERYAAAIYKKNLKYSGAIRQGVADSLAILASLKGEMLNTSHGYIDSICSKTVLDALENADWKQWGSLNRLLPSLAESAPSQFLSQIEKALRDDKSPFKELFSQRGSGFTTQDYLAGILWSLELLAWNESSFVRVCVALAEFESLYIDEKVSNSPLSSLVSILLPWYPQTVASVDKRFVAIDAIAEEYPKVAWEVVIQLLPNQQKTTAGTYKPKFSSSEISTTEVEVSRVEYSEQIVYYSQKAIALAKNDKNKLSQLIDISEKLTKNEFGLLLNTLGSTYISELSEEDQHVIWSHVAKLVRKHRRWPTADWSLSELDLSRIEDSVAGLAPKDPRYKYLELFTSSSFDLFEENGDWSQQELKLQELREEAICEIYSFFDLKGVFEFIDFGANSKFVGSSLGRIADKRLDDQLIPIRLTLSSKEHSFIEGYITSRQHSLGWEWVDKFDRSTWTNEQLALLLVCLPFCCETWERASRWLGSHQDLYWKKCDVLPFQANVKLSHAADKLLDVDRPKVAAECLNFMLRHKEVIDDEKAVQALMESIASKEPENQMDLYNSIDLIKHLQASSYLNEETVIKVEWAYLSVLDGYHGATPKLMYLKLSNEPEFFCEVIRIIYRSSKLTEQQISKTKVDKQLASQAWKLLHNWRTPPGTKDGEVLDIKAFQYWVDKVVSSCEVSGHLDVALNEVGKVLYYSPKDPSGLWINKAVASVLNQKNNDSMRDGFRIEILNSRGAHIVDPTGNNEFELEAQFRSKAEEIENAGYFRLAESLRMVAENYHQEALRTISHYQE